MYTPDEDVTTTAAAPPMATPASRLRPAADAAAAVADAMRVLLALTVLYGAMSFLVYHVIHMRHVAPLGPDALPGVFSEGRVLQHLRRLAVDIPGRQEGSPGLEAAAQYIKGQLEGLAAQARPEYRVEVEETLVSGSFSMMFLRHRVTLGYRNHKNIVMRISSNVSEEDEPSLLVNGHFDSPLGSPGAADCGSCVASMLELSRLILESGWVPPRPVIFLFNGAEELFLLGSHGFIKTHKWNSTIGAFINIEASGSGGADLVCQSGPGSWPSRIYAQTAKYPMANSVAQCITPYQGFKVWADADTWFERQQQEEEMKRLQAEHSAAMKEAEKLHREKVAAEKDGEKEEADPMAAAEAQAVKQSS